MRNFLKSIPKIILILTWVDTLAISASSLVVPVFAIFVTRQIEGGSATVVGLGAAVYWLVKSLFQLPIANFLDKNKGERDDFYAMILGYSLIAIVFFSYLLAERPFHIYILQGILGFGDALGVPAYLAVFSRHLKKLHESTEWTVRSVPIGLVSAGTAALGGILVDKFGFSFVFVLAGLLALFAVASILFIYPELEKRKELPFSVSAHSIGWPKTRR